MLTLTPITQSKVHQDCFQDLNSSEETRWAGFGSTQLGLTNPVEPDVFSDLINRKLPLKILPTRTSDEHSSYDLTFTVPKSLSILALVGEQNDLIQAHKNAVLETILYLEKSLKKRMVIALFQHETNVSREPCLHTHALITGSISDDFSSYSLFSEKQIVSQIEMLKAVFASSLAIKLRELGYDIDAREGNSTHFEIQGVTPEIINRFFKTTHSK